MKILLASASWTAPPLPTETVFDPRNGNSLPGSGAIDDHLRRTSFGHEVTNITCPSRSNYFVINHLKLTLLHETFDKIVFVQTEPLRDSVYTSIYLIGWRELTIKWFDDHLHLLSIQRDILDETYKTLNDIGIPIYLVGGCSKVDTELLSKYSNLTCIMPSIPEFLSPGYTHPTIFGFSQWQKRIDDKWDLDTIDYILDQIKSTEWLHANCPHFFDDIFHPDSEGYRKVAEHIENYFLARL